MLFKRKNKEPEYTTYEADEYYYEEYIAKTQEPPKKPRRTLKTPSYDEGYGYEGNYSLESFEDDETQRRLSNLSSKILVALVLYGFFLGIGFVSTSSYPNEIGEEKALVVNIAMLEERENYYSVRDQYSVLKSIVMQVNEIDEMFNQSNEEQFFGLAAQYQDVLPQIDKMLPLARAMSIDPKYRNLKNQSVSIYESIAIYLQKMGTALIEKNTTAFEEAITWREKYLYDFEQFRHNMIEFSKMVKIEDDNLVENLPEIFPLDTERISFKESEQPPQEQNDDLQDEEEEAETDE